MPGMPAMSPDAPSLQGFQQFLAAQKPPPPQPGMARPSDPNMSMPFTSICPVVPGAAGEAPSALPLPMGVPALMPAGTAISNGGMSQLPQKRRFDEVDDTSEDVSVEERRALLDRYRIPR